MIDDRPTRWYRLTPDRLVIGLLVVECLLWLSQRFQWFPFNERKGWTVLIAVAVVGVAFLVMLLWFIVALVFRWRFQFSIRSLLMLTVAVAIPCSWLAAEMQKARATRAAIEAINEFGGFVSYGDYGGPLDTIYFQPNSGWLDVLLGDEYESLTFYNNTAVTDAALENFGGLKHVQLLILAGTQVTDAGLEYLRGMERLACLHLWGTKVTDGGLIHLKGMKQLRWLNLGGTKVTDVGLEHLMGLRQLEFLDLRGTKVTYAGVKKLQQALPNCKIDWDDDPLW